MYSPWATSMPCLFSNNSNNNYENNQEFNNNGLINSLNNLDLSSPFNIFSSLSPTSSNWSLNNYNSNFPQINEQELQTNYFEPLPFFNTQNEIKQNNHLQLSQKHTIIKQMIARKTKQQQYNRSYYNSCENLSSSKFYRRKQQICSFCKSNGESANVFKSHMLRNVNNEIECPILMAYICPKCGATGKSAHTIKYCTALSENERVALPTIKLLKSRSSSGSMNFFKK